MPFLCGEQVKTGNLKCVQPKEKHDQIIHIVQIVGFPTKYFPAGKKYASTTN